jgi:hydrogenase-4 component B
MLTSLASNSMTALLAAIGLLLLSGCGALLCGRSARRASMAGAGGAVLGCITGTVAALGAWPGGRVPGLDLAWAVPGGAFSVGIDALSAFFLVTTFALAALAAVYGSGYLARTGRGRPVGPVWFFFNLLVASIVMVLVARNAVLFLMAWEVMTLASFFLVTLEDEKEQHRQAGRTYLVATHVGGAFLLALFALLGRASGSLDFEDFSWGATGPPGAGGLFLLALVGFGAKAGFAPLHVWLPEAHPAAPSHVSALMSGVMLKVGIYGLLRTTTFLGAPDAWWGWLLIGVGLTSGFLGILFALAQHDLKRVLAYSSVENVGIIALGLGAALLGAAAGSPLVTVLGCTGALLHVINHAAFKGLLFLGAGAVAQATGTTELDRLGGLLRRMPLTGATFFVGAAAISGLPPLNGFVGEFLIYLGAYAGLNSLAGPAALPLLGVIAGLALTGGLALACFARAFGIVFLGQPRSAPAVRGHDPARAMLLPMLLLAAVCVLLALLSPFFVRGLGPVVSAATGLEEPEVQDCLSAAAQPLLSITLAGLGLLALILVLALFVRRRTLARTVGPAPTWDCGWAEPGARMQYTSSSFAQPLTSLFQPILRTRRVSVAPSEIFPVHATLETRTPDLVREHVLVPLCAAVERVLPFFRRLQEGRVQIYVLYIALTLLALLLWQLEHLR